MTKECLSFGAVSGWADGDGAWLEDCKDGEDWNEFMRRSGYEKRNGWPSSLGDASGQRYTNFAATVWEREEGAPRFVVELEDVSNYTFVAVQSLPDLMALWEKISGMYPAYALERVEIEVVPAFERLFYALHGHEAGLDCMQCAPNAVRARQKAVRADGGGLLARAKLLTGKSQ